EVTAARTRYAESTIFKTVHRMNEPAERPPYVRLERAGRDGFGLAVGVWAPRRCPARSEVPSAGQHPNPQPTARRSLRLTSTFAVEYPGPFGRARAALTPGRARGAAVCRACSGPIQTL